MRWLKRGFWGLLGLLVLLAIALGIYTQRSFPQLDGQLNVPGLQQALTIERDGADVTHIRAQSQHGAWFGIGFVHAQERGWQLEFNRRVMRGELSEILGPATLETDKLLRTLGIRRAAAQQLAKLPYEAQAALQAYSNGISAFYASSTQALPPEFHLLRTEPGGSSGVAWSPVDSVGWSLMMALDLSGNWSNEFARLSAASVLDTERLWQLFTPYPGEPPAANADLSQLYRGLGLYRSQPAAATASIADFQGGKRAGATLDAIPEEKTGFSLPRVLADAANRWASEFSGGLGLLEGKGSNNWVVAGSHSASGKPLLANDPHLGLSAPAIWYMARLQAPAGQRPDGSVSPAIDVIGATLPGLPFVVLGRTAQLAWGFTNTGPDVQDLYIEQINPANPAQYRVPLTDGGNDDAPAWADFAIRQETIRVKGAPNVVLTVRETRHGPVISGAQASHAELLDLSKHVMALRWSALDTNNRTVLAGLRANQANTVPELLAAYADHHSPMQNLVAADASGAIAFKAIGQVPLRQPDNNIRGMAPSPGWDLRYDWAGWIPAAETPQNMPAAGDGTGWLSSANQRITPPGYLHFMGQDWTVPYRFDRIEQLLAASPQHTLATMQALQADTVSPATQKLLPTLQKTASSHPLASAAQAQIKTFNGDMRADSAAALIFAVWVDELTRGLIAPRIGAERFKALYGKRHFRSAVEGIIERNDAWWCAPLACAAQSSAALDRALSRLQATEGADPALWRWGNVHRATSTHRPLGNVAALAHFFDVQTPSGGDTFSINVGQYWAGDGNTPLATAFASRHAASLRAIYDLADLEKSLFIYQTGQSGLVFSSRYRNMAGEWGAVRYRPLQLKPTTIRHQLVLQP